MHLDYHHLSLLWDLLVTASAAFVAVEVPEHFVLEYNLYISSEFTEFRISHVH